MRDEHEVHRGGGGQVGGAADEHAGAEGREHQGQPSNVGADFFANALRGLL